MRNRIGMILLLVLLLGGFVFSEAQDSQLRPKKELTADYILDAESNPTQGDVEAGDLIDDLQDLEPIGDWLDQFSWYAKIERFLPGLIILGLLLGKIAKYTPGKQDDLISGLLVVLGGLFKRKG